MGYAMRNGNGKKRIIYIYRYRYQRARILLFHTSAHTYCLLAPSSRSHAQGRKPSGVTKLDEKRDDLTSAEQQTRLPNHKLKQTRPRSGRNIRRPLGLQRRPRNLDTPTGIMPYGVAPYGIPLSRSPTSIPYGAAPSGIPLSRSTTGIPCGAAPSGISLSRSPSGIPNGCKL